MSVFHQIVVGVDFSPNSTQAVRAAARIRGGVHTGLNIVHILDRRVVEDLRDHTQMSEERIRNQTAERLERWTEDILGKDHGAVTEAVVGHPFDGLIGALERHHADLLVIGSRGLNTPQGHPGSVAAKCIRKAPCDVLLVRRDQGGPFKKIVACVDFSETSAKAIRTARRLAAAEGAAVQALHVHVPALFAGAMIEPFPPTAMEAVEESRERSGHVDFQNFLANQPHEGQPMESVFRINPSATDGIVDHLTRENADLAVLGTRGRSGLKILLLGTTAERLVHEAPCSVLTIKAGDSA